MVELVAKSAFDAAFPVEIGAVTLSEVDLGHVTFVQPLKGQAAAVAAALKSALGGRLPDPGEAGGAGDARALWCGPGQSLVMGDCPVLTGAATVDQSDAFAVLRIEGVTARDVLARLTLLDVRAGVFEQGCGVERAGICLRNAEAGQGIIYQSLLAGRQGAPARAAERADRIARPVCHQSVQVSALGSKAAAAALIVDRSDLRRLGSSIFSKASTRSSVSGDMTGAGADSASSATLVRTGASITSAPSKK